MTRLAAIAGNRKMLACAAVACAAAALAGGQMAGGALRAAAVVLLLAWAASAFRRRPGASVAAALAIAERHVVARDVGLALVVVDGRRLLVGYAPSGVALVAELAAVPPGEAP